MKILFLTLFISLIAENRNCYRLDYSCNKKAIQELRIKCPNLDMSLSSALAPETLLIASGKYCIKIVPNNFYVKKYSKFFQLNQY